VPQDLRLTITFDTSQEERVRGVAEVIGPPCGLLQENARRAMHPYFLGAWTYTNPVFTNPPILPLLVRAGDHMAGVVRAQWMLFSKAAVREC
jgi:hypothetical protein